MAGFGTVGLNVGFVGRWFRLMWGVLILVPIGLDFYEDVGESFSVVFWALTAVLLVVIALTYVAVYYVLGERFLSRAHAWINTAIFVGPALLVAWWNLLAPEALHLPAELIVAMAIYIGASFVLEWRIKYGGCEVVSLPVWLSGRRYVTYCIPLVVVDAAEKRAVETGQRGRRTLWMIVTGVAVLLLLAWIVTSFF